MKFYCKILGKNLRILCCAFFSVVFANLCCAEIQVAPKQKIELENNIITMNLAQNKLLVGTDLGEILELDIREQKPKLLIKIPNIASFYSQSYAPKVHSVDRIGEKILVLSEGDYGGKKLYMLENGVLKSLQDVEFPSVKKVAFVDENSIFLGLSSNEIILYDLKSQTISYRKQLSEAPFSDFALDLERGRYVVACESGILYYGEIQSGKVIKELEGVNKDNVYQVRMAHTGEYGYFITAGQDRQVALYTLSLKDNKESFYGLRTDFLVYSVGLSQEGRILGAYMKNEQSDIQIFDVVSRESIVTLRGHENLLNTMIFIDSSHLISSEDGKNILIWEW